MSYLCDARVALEGGSSGDGRLGGDDVRVRERGGGHDDVSVCADARDDGAREAPAMAPRVGVWCFVAFLDIFCVHYGWWEDHDRDRSIERRSARTTDRGHAPPVTLISNRLSTGLRQMGQTVPVV